MHKVLAYLLALMKSCNDLINDIFTNNWINVNCTPLSSKAINLGQADWEIVMQAQDCQEAFKFFWCTLSDTYYHSFPINSIRTIYQFQKPWLSLALQNSIKQKDKLYHLSFIHPTIDSI